MIRAEQMGEVSRRGGWRGSPNSLAALFRYQVRFPAQRRPRRCHFKLSAAGGRAERRYLDKLERRGLLPLDLLALPVWRNLAGLKMAQRSPLRLALVQAWDHRQAAPLRWAAVQRQAIDLAAMPGPRQAKGFYDN